MPHNIVDAETIPEVGAYEESKEMLEVFLQANSQVFDTYHQLVEELNQKLEAADKVVRAQGVSVSDWDLYQFQTKVDAETLFNALGTENFLRAGGKMSSKTVYTADKSLVEAAVARGEIPQGVAESVLVKSPRFKAPKPR